MAEERLHKYLARAGICSRRMGEELIRQGKIKVDGQTVTELGTKIDPERQQVLYQGQPVKINKKIYLLLNKPKGIVTTVKDPQGRPTVLSLLTDIKERVYPVGRLDIDTEGALLLTNDGELANHVLHPRYEVNKTYHAWVNGHITLKNIRALESGIMLEGKKTWPAQIQILKRTDTATRLSITIHEGRKHQVRKMFAAVGHPVQALKRTAYGNLELGSLPSGKYRILTPNDLKKLFSGKNNLYKKIYSL